MAKILIDIPDETYEYVKQNYRYGIGAGVACKLGFAVAESVQLPKGHGRLIDADALIKWLEIYNERYNKRFAKTPIKDIPMYDLGHRNRNDDVISIIDRFLTIIERDKDSE